MYLKCGLMNVDSNLTGAWRHTTCSGNSSLESTARGEIAYCAFLFFLKGAIVFKSLAHKVVPANMQLNYYTPNPHRGLEA